MYDIIWQAPTGYYAGTLGRRGLYCYRTELYVWSVAGPEAYINLANRRVIPEWEEV